MKLVELLARKLKYWNETTDCYCQDSCGRVFPWIGRPEFDGSEWEGDSDGANVDREYAAKTVQSQLASDHATAIVTREMWKAERDRIAKPGKKANSDGWIRHRGGKCPVDDGVIVEVRLRGGTEWTGRDAEVGEFWHWRHGGGSGDIMAYRIHKPAEQPAPEIKVTHIDHEAGVIHAESVSSSCGPITLDWQEVQPITAATKRAHPVDDCEPDPSQRSSPIVINLRDPHPENPLIWRDRIREIDRAVEALEEERVSLIQRLEGEGLQLLQGKVCGSVIPEFDAGDKETWRIGDKLEIVGSDNDGWLTRKGMVGQLCYDNDMYTAGWYIKFEDAGDWCVSDNTDLKFHSRPSA